MQRRRLWRSTLRTPRDPGIIALLVKSIDKEIRAFKSGPTLSLCSVRPSSLKFIMSGPNKRVKIYTAEDVESHKTSASCWVSRGNKVYDVSAFLPDHPGGDDLILKYAGQDIDKTMNDPEEHEHSDSAYDMMDEYLIGRLGNQAAIVDESTLQLLHKISIGTHSII